jgi:hypothetical protein
MTDHRLTDPKAVAARGEEIYAQRYRESYEAQHRGQFLVIDVTTGEAYLGATPEDAVTRARQQAPSGLFHLIRIGEPGAFRVSYTASAARRFGLSA